MPATEHIDKEEEVLDQTTGRDHRIDVNSRSSNRQYYNSRDDMESYVWSVAYNASNNDYILYLRNTNPDKDLYITSVDVGSKLKSIFSLSRVTGLGSGADSSEVNLNLKSSNEALAVHLGGDVGDIGTATMIDCRTNDAYSGSKFEFNGSLILGEGDAIAIKAEENPSSTCASITGFFE